MLTVWAPQTESLWDESLPVEVKELPVDLAALDVLLSDPALLWPAVRCWRREFEQTGRAVLTDGRPTIAIETYVRLMVLKQRYRWGYRSLVAEVSDSIHLRRFCRISLSERVPDESTVRKLTRRIGPETVSEMTRALIVTATREKRFRPRAVRIDSTVIEADVKYPTDAGLASAGVRTLAREGRKLAKLIGSKTERCGIARGRWGASCGRFRARSAAAPERPGRGAQAHGRDRRAVGALGQGSAPARRGRQAQGAGRGAKGKQRAAAKLEELAGRCEKVARQIKQRVAGEPIKDRIVSLFDPDARPIRKGKLGKPTEFGYVSQLAELTENTKTGARGPILPASTQIGNPSETTLLPGTVAELERLGISPTEVALDGGFMPGPTNTALAALEPKTVFIAGRQQPASKRTQRRLQRYRTGQEGRISHLKRRYGLDRSRLKGDQGRQIWTEWAILAYNTDTLAVRTR